MSLPTTQHPGGSFDFADLTQLHHPPMTTCSGLRLRTVIYRLGSGPIQGGSHQNPDQRVPRTLVMPRLTKLVSWI